MTRMAANEAATTASPAAEDAMAADASGTAASAAKPVATSAAPAPKRGAGNRQRKKMRPAPQGRGAAAGKRTRAGFRSGRGRGLKYRTGRRSAARPGPEWQGKDEGGYAEGYERGLYEGGEQWLEQSVPQHLLLPDVSLRDVIALGVEQLRPRCHPLLGVPEVFDQMEAAIAEGRPCSVVRLGDGELLALAQDVVYDAAAVHREGRFLPYAGLTAPDLAARDQLAMALRHAQIVGVPLSRRKNFQPLLHRVLRGHGIDPGVLRMTHSTINYGLYQSGLLSRLLAGRRLLLVGNAAPALAETLAGRGFNVTGVISPVAGFPDIGRVMAEANAADFDIALVSAGIPAVVLCWRIAMERRKVALDFGHMADMIVDGH